MIITKKNRTVLLVATWGAIAATHGSLLAPFAAFCSAWTLEPGFRHYNRRGYYRKNHNNDHLPNRQRSRRHNDDDESRLFSSSAQVASSEGTTTSAAACCYRDLFPASDTVANGTLQPPGGVHTLYYEIHGTGPLTALFLHGGPGAGCFPNHARFFDPTRYTVVLLDQRGAGRSTPRGCVVDNTLGFLVEDCERLRYHLQPIFLQRRNSSSSSDIPWDVVMGGSWGATLGLAYYQKHPWALRSLILRGVCALRPSEIDWLFGAGGGSARAFPEAWKNFSGAVGITEDNNGGRETLHAYYDCLFNNANGTNGEAVNNTIRLAAARAWMGWEMGVTSSSSSGAAPRTNNSNTFATNKSGAVLVSSPDTDGGNWRFENHLGEPLPVGYATADRSPPETVASRLRRHIAAGNGGNRDGIIAVGPRRVRPVDGSMPLLAGSRSSNNNKTNNATGGFRLPPDYVPAQAMLTCYYSVNDRFVMGNQNLLETAAAAGNNNGNTPPPVARIIGIQGGKDPICPPDTALDLLRSLRVSTNNMELRIPLESGHSMYDPGIKHELVRATDRLADEFLEPTIKCSE